jgi:hypothetical protein
MLTGVREFALDPDESAQFADAAKEVMRHYPIGLSEKTLAWINLAIVGGGIYGTRFMAYNLRKSAERKARIVNLSPAGSGAPGPAPGPASPPPANGHAADLTPAFLTVPPEGETIL